MAGSVDLGVCQLILPLSVVLDRDQPVAAAVEVGSVAGSVAARQAEEKFGN